MNSSKEKTRPRERMTAMTSKNIEVPDVMDKKLKEMEATEEKK